MKINTGIIATVALLVALALICGCTGTTDQTPTVKPVKELSFGYQPSTHQIAYMTAMEKGWWQTDLAPYGVESIKEFQFPTGAPEMQAMLAGEIEVAYVGAAPVISALATGLDAKIVAGVQTQGSNLVLRTEIPYESPADLKGLTLATFPPGTIQDTLLRNWLKENGLDPDNDVDIRPMGPGDAITAITAAQVDGVFLPHPAPTIIEVEGNGRSVVASGEMEKNHACCVLVVTGDLIRNHPDLVEEIIKIHINATEYNIAHPDEAAEIFSVKTKWDVETVKKSINEWDGSWTSDPSLIIDSVVDYTTIQSELGYITKPMTRDEIFDTSFYEKVTA